MVIASAPAMAGAELDRNRSYGTVYGGGPIRFQQDHRLFDDQGLEVGEDGKPVFQPRQRSSELKQAGAGRNSDQSAKSRSAAGERMRRTRQRRRAGIVAVVSVEVTNQDIARLVARNLLLPDEVHDRKTLAKVVRRALELWNEI